MTRDSARSLPADSTSDKPLTRSTEAKSEAALSESGGSERTKIVMRVLQAAWMSIALGLSMQILTLAVQTSFQKQPGVATAVADTVQRVSWSTIVCLGLAIGATASKLRGQAMGLFGFISAPLGFAVAKSLQKSTAQALSIEGLASEPSTTLLWTLASTKGFEYLILGVLLWRINLRTPSHLKAHFLCGLGVGVTFAAIILAETFFMSGDAPPAPKIAVLILNELVFPVGCSMVIYFSSVLAGCVQEAPKGAYPT